MVMDGIDAHRTCRRRSEQVVGSIRWTVKVGQELRKGDEVGSRAWGGVAARAAMNMALFSLQKAMCAMPSSPGLENLPGHPPLSQLLFLYFSSLAGRLLCFRRQHAGGAVPTGGGHLGCRPAAEQVGSGADRAAVYITSCAQLRPWVHSSDDEALLPMMRLHPLLPPMFSSPPSCCSLSSLETRVLMGERLGACASRSGSKGGEA